MCIYTSMTYFQNRLQEVNTYPAPGDTHLGYRCLPDAAIETLDFTVYEHTLHFCDWYDAAAQTRDRSALLSQVHRLLTVIEAGYNASRKT